MENQTLNAAKNYFLIHLCTVLSDRNIACPTKVEMEDAIAEAITLTEAEMDGTTVYFELTEHCVHWAADLWVDETEKVEIPLHAMSIKELHIQQPFAFFSEIVRMAVLDLEVPHISPENVLKASNNIEEILSLCRGCENCYYLQEVKFAGSAPVFCFRTKMTGASSERLYITYEVPWPQL